jgi:hypothetical protein
MRGLQRGATYLATKGDRGSAAIAGRAWHIRPPGQYHPGGRGYQCRTSLKS